MNLNLNEPMKPLPADRLMKLCQNNGATGTTPNHSAGGSLTEFPKTNAITKAQLPAPK